MDAREIAEIAEIIARAIGGLIKAIAAYKTANALLKKYTKEKPTTTRKSKRRR